MKTSQVYSVMVGAALLSGAALAQADGPRGPGPRGEGPGFRPEGERRERLEQRERAEFRERQERRGPEREGFGAEGRPGRGPEGAERPQMRRGGPMLGRGPQEIPSPMRLKEAGATEQQLEALKKFSDEQQLKRIDLQAAVEKAEATLGQLMQGEAADEKAAHKAVDALSQARAELLKQEISSKLKTKEILGAEVVKKIRAMGPPAGVERPGRGPRPERPEQPCKDAPAGERPLLRDQK